MKRHVNLVCRRSVNNGNELVPTVVVGDVVLSAPSADDITYAIAGAR